MVVALCIAWLLFYVVLAVGMMRDLHMNDFGKFYYSARLFLDGQDIYGPSPATSIPVSETESREFLNMNPPHFHLLMLPFALLGPVNALVLWAGLNLIALFLSLRAIARELHIEWTRKRIMWSTCAIILCSATGAVVVTGQLTFLLLLPVTFAWIAARHGDWNKSAALLGVCASVKPFLGIFLIYLILRRDIKAAVIMIVSGVVCAVAGLAVFGWTAYANWLAAVSSVDWTWAPMNGSLAALVARAFDENPYYTPAVLAPWLMRPLTTILALAVAGISLRALLRNAAGSADYVFGVLLLTAQLVSPLGWIYYLWLIVGPATALFRSSRLQASVLGDGLAVLAVPGLLVPYVVTTQGTDSPWFGLTLGSIYLWTTLLLWGSLIAYSGIGAKQRDARTAAETGTSRAVNATA
jgi:alpha-1,2-mannosyltransferase